MLFSLITFERFILFLDFLQNGPKRMNALKIDFTYNAYSFLLFNKSFIYYIMIITIKIIFRLLAIPYHYLILIQFMIK